MVLVSTVRTVHPGDRNAHEESDQENDAAAEVVVKQLEDVHAALNTQQCKRPRHSMCLHGDTMTPVYLHAATCILAAASCDVTVQGPALIARVTHVFNNCSMVVFCFYFCYILASRLVALLN